MELTLLAPSLGADALPRHPLVRAVRAGQGGTGQGETGRTRTRDLRVVWHDDPVRTLARNGLVLSEEGGVWRLERHAPDKGETWPPGFDHLTLATGATRDALTPVPPGLVETEALEPVAVFEGKRAILPLTVGGSPVTLNLMYGTLRAGEAYWPAARLSLAGPAAAVSLFARTLGEGMEVALPSRSLAAEAMAHLGGPVPAPDWRGPPMPMRRDLTVAGAYAHVLGHLTGVLLLLIPGVADPAGGTEPVHQMRVAARRARAALTVFRPAMDGPDLVRVAVALKQLGQRLGPARDRDVFMTETLPMVEAALSRPTILAPLKRLGVKRRAETRAALAVWLEGRDCRLLCLELACLASPDDLAPSGAGPEPEASGSGLPDFAAAVLDQTWRRLRKAGKGLAEQDHASVHRFRLKAKRMRYAAEFFAPLFPGGAGARFSSRLASLQEHLGVFNDAAVAANLPANMGARPGIGTGAVMGFMAARGVGIRPDIVRAWKRLRRRTPFWA